MTSSGRSTPSQTASHHRKTSTLSHIRQAQISGPRTGENVLASLRATQINTSKPVLPAELIATILDYVAVPDLLRCARVSHRLREMVYDDTRWIQKLKAIGVWDDAEARKRVEDAMKRKAEALQLKEAEEAAKRASSVNGSAVAAASTSGRQHAGSTTLFDANAEESKYRKSLERPQYHPPKRKGTLSEGFDEITPPTPISPSTKPWDPTSALTVLQRVHSVRGYARQEFGKIYGALGPLYNNLARSKRQSDAVIFRTYRDPEQQAQILASLKRFARCDSALGWREREQKLDSIVGVFENAVLREFEQGVAAGDVEGRMKRYAHVLCTLNGGSAGVDYFISTHPVMARKVRLGNPLDCLDGVAQGHVDLNPSRNFFEGLASQMVQQAEVIEKVFPESVDVLTPFLSRLCEEIISDYLTALLDEAHQKNVETYVKAVAGTFEQALRFVASLKPTLGSPRDFEGRAKEMITLCYEKHIDLYLAEELGVFTSKSDAEVQQWEKDFAEREASKESFYMSNFNRQSAKRDFLSSFKKVVMMPVNVLPAFNTSKAPPIKSAGKLDAGDSVAAAERSRSPTLNGAGTPKRPGTPVPEAPTTELAAKAAVMNSRLEGIKSLFSIEVALNLTHMAKASIERAALMVRMGGAYGDEAKEQCEAIFVSMLAILGDRHIKNGFDKAVGHLSNYNPREVREMKVGGSDGVEGDRGVEPLVTFLELVNVGDLIQQMVDVFYAQELVATKLVDADDFLDPAVKEKKRFEQMLDERVAAGLNRGIDVLMDEVEFICATTQLSTDFNPGAAGNADNASSTPNIVDIGPSKTAREIVAMVSSHTGMLVGSTDKNMLDVFTQEVGLRLFAVLCKHFKRQRISVDGSIKLISDINHYSAFIASLRQKPLQPYFQALREMAQIYLVYIDPPAVLFGSNAKGVKRASILSGKGSKTAAQAKELATIIADAERYHGIFPAEEVYEFAERRADWYLVKGDVEKAMYGVGCCVM